MSTWVWVGIALAVLVGVWLLLFALSAARWSLNNVVWHRLTALSPVDDVVIPPILHRTSHLDRADLPLAILELYRRTERENPDWQVVYTSFDDGRKLLAQHFDPSVLDAFDCLIPAAFKSDLLRLCLVYLYGGAYSDFSQTFLVPLDELVDRSRDKLVLSLDNPKTMLMLFRPLGLSNAFFAARPRHPFIAACISRLVANVQARYYGDDPMDPTGPRLWMKVLNQHQHAQGLDYRMSIGMVTPMIAALSNDSMFHELCGLRRPVIQHKLKEHYQALGAGAMFNSRGTHYIDLYMARKIYRTA